MFDYIKGELVFKGDDSVVVENNGIGYLIKTNQRTISLLNEINSTVKIYTKLVHKEDSMTLVGFKQKEDRVIFDVLTSVSGIGTKVALVLLDEFSGSELIDYVINEDFKSISRAKGVGVKLAQKIIIELKGKLTSSKTTLLFITVEGKAVTRHQFGESNVSKKESQIVRKKLNEILVC